MFAEHLLCRVGAEQADAFAAHNRRWHERTDLEAFPQGIQSELAAAGHRLSELIRAEHYREVGG